MSAQNKKPDNKQPLESPASEANNSGSSSKIKWLFIAIPLAIIFFTILTYSPPLTWQTDYQQAIELAKQQDKAVLILFTIPEANQGKLMKNACEAGNVRSIIKETFVPIICDGRKYKELVKEYDIASMPTIVLKWPDNDKNFHINTFRADRLAKKMQDFLDDFPQPAKRDINK
jgi:thioredoxin-related protein